MDSSSYKSFTSSRGIVTSYYFAAGSSEKPFLLFLHGFPSSSQDWRHQVAFFSQKGYGLVVPDMLGYGGSSKPTDLTQHKPSLMVKDLVELLDSEKIGKVIVIGHDWGCKFVGRLANYYPDKFLGFGFLSVGYTAPTVGEPKLDLEQLLAWTKKTFGYELFGYWKFFSEEGADKVIEAHWESFMSILYAKNAELWIDNMAPTGALKAWLLANKTTETLLTDEELEADTEILRKGGIASPLSYYKVMTSDIDHEDNQAIPKENILIKKPVFFGAAKKDYIARAEIGKPRTLSSCEQGVVTVQEYDAGHWVMIQAKDEVNRDLLSWIEGLTL